MSPENDAVKPRLALIAGPTASGKSDLAVRLAMAERAAGREAVVINADSAQVYADLAVLSARPDADEMRGVPHRLFGTWDGAEACSAADWARAASAEIAAAHAQGALPILVGGTGMYIGTLLDGIAPFPPIAPDVRARVRAMPVAEAYAALQREDPERAAALAPADVTRIARSLEVIRSTGRPLRAWQASRTGGIREQVRLLPVILAPERAWPLAYLKSPRFWAERLTRAMPSPRASRPRAIMPSANTPGYATSRRTAGRASRTKIPLTASI